MLNQSATLIIYTLPQISQYAGFEYLENELPDMYMEFFWRILFLFFLNEYFKGFIDANNS